MEIKTTDKTIKTKKDKPLRGDALIKKLDTQYKSSSIGELVKAGLYPAVEVEKNVFILSKSNGVNDWEELAESRAVARGMSACMSGSFYYSQNHVIRVSGRTQEYIHTSRSYEQLISARFLAGIIGSEDAKSKKSTGAVGRSLIDWIIGDDLKQLDAALEHKMSVDIANEPSWSYMRVEPGDYDEMVHLDVSGYYHSIAKRIKNPIPSFNPFDGKLAWRNAGKAAKRWQVVVETIAGNKQLRNNIIGQMCSGSDVPRMEYFVNGKPRPVVCRPSKLAALGHLIVRCGTEMTQRTSIEIDSVYTCVDCVIAKQTNYTELGETYWERCGFEVHRNGRGKAKICNLSNYQMNGWRKLSDSSSLENFRIGDKERPRIEYHREVCRL